jgi:NAD(P)H-nitrite reductase large subunit
MLPDAGGDVELFTNVFLLNRLGDAGVAVRTKTKVDEITKEGVLSDKEYLAGGWLTEADTVVFAVGIKSDNRLFVSLKNHIQELFAIGDSQKPRNMLHAIHEGARVARSI